LLSGLIPKPADALLKPVLKPVGEKVKTWLDEAPTRKALAKAAERAESEFRSGAKEKFGNDELTQAVATFPVHNAELFQAALQSLPEHLNETMLARHVHDQISEYWSGKFSAEQISAGVALYLDWLRHELLHMEASRPRGGAARGWLD
jgi:hypothetical protein